MSSYASSTGTGQASVWTATRSVLLAAGWTETVISSVSGTRSSAFTGIAVDSTAANAPTIVVGETTASSLVYFQSGADWDPVTKTLIAQCGDTTTSILATTSGTNKWFIRANNYAVFAVNLVSASYNKAYAGLLKRGLASGRSGVTKATTSLAIGATSIPTASDMTGKLQVNQFIHVQNFAHTSGNANAAHAERVKVTAISSSALTVTALTKAYDTGALVGDRPMNCCAGGNTIFEFPTASSIFTPYLKDGSRTSNTGQILNFNSSEVGPSPYMKPDPSSGEYDIGFGVLSWNTNTTAGGFAGYPFNAFFTTTATATFEDLFDDGSRQYIIIGANTGVITAMATS